MKTIKPWLSAFRLRTLPLSISGIIVGSCFAHFNGFFNIYIFLLAILTTVCLQILSNLANDYGDGIKGTDNEQRIGPERAIQSGAISSHQMFEAIKINILLAIVLSFSLIYLSFGQGHFLYVLVFFFLAGASIIAAMNYTMGNKAYGYRGLGDIFVFIFFGLLSVIGSYFLYTKHLDHLIILPSIVIGLLSVGVLNLNNMRDIESDKQAGKITLAVRLGEKKAKIYHMSLIISAMIITLIFGILYYKLPSNFLFLIAFLPLIIHLKKIKDVTSPKDYDPQLKVLALSTFILAILLGVGYIL
jgi:1,4-dihydroxy-2-naphthoate octaprenyltransferase